MKDGLVPPRRATGPGLLLWGGLILLAGAALVATLLPVANCSWCEGLPLGPVWRCHWCQGRGRLTVLGRWRQPRPPVKSWDEVMSVLRSGGAFDDLSRPEGIAFLRVRAMGGCAFPRLITYIDHEDPLLGRAAVAVLNKLTGLNRPLPNDATKTTLKAEWESGLKKGRFGASGGVESR